MWDLRPGTIDCTASTKSLCRVFSPQLLTKSPSKSPRFFIGYESVCLPLSICHSHHLPHFVTSSLGISFWIFLFLLFSLWHRVSPFPVPRLRIWLCSSHYCLFLQSVQIVIIRRQDNEELVVLKADLFPQEIPPNIALIWTNCHLMSVLLSGVRVYVCVWLTENTTERKRKQTEVVFMCA